jgi:hypothetical protein
MSEQRCELSVVKAISCELFCNRQGVDTRANRNGRSHRFSAIKYNALSRTRQRKYRRIFVKLERQGHSGHFTALGGVLASRRRKVPSAWPICPSATTTTRARSTASRYIKDSSLSYVQQYTSYDTNFDSLGIITTSVTKARQR